MKALNCLALYQDEQTLPFWQDIQTYFTDLVRITIAPLADFEPATARDYQAILTTSHLKTTQPCLLLDPSQHPWKIAEQIRQFVQTQTPQLLDYLPLRLSIFDDKGQVTYSNNRPDGSFFFDDEIEPLDSWLLSEIKSSEKGSLHLPIPLEGFNQRIMHSYQALYDDQKNLVGFFQYTQDISPLLKTYLDDSGQALVGWSDVTSGASISNHDD